MYSQAIVSGGLIECSLLKKRQRSPFCSNLSCINHIYSASDFKGNLIISNTRQVTSTQKSLNMPLVVPGITSQSGDKTEEWTNKLVGKKIHDGEDSNETVSFRIDWDIHFHLPTRLTGFRSSLQRGRSLRSTGSFSLARW